MATVKNEKYLFTGLTATSDELKKSVIYLGGVEDSKNHAMIGDLSLIIGELIQI